MLMDGPTARMLFESLRQDIRALKSDVTDVLERHDKKIEELEKIRWKWVGAFAALAIVFEIGIKLLGAALK